VFSLTVSCCAKTAKKENNNKTNKMVNLALIKTKIIAGINISRSLAPALQKLYFLSLL
jgi:hypothetical protein